MALLISIFWILFLLSILVIVHELGHFFAAKWAKVHVEEFGIGFPPRVAKLFTWRNTPFTLNAIPIGGFVRLFGDDSETVEQLEAVEQVQQVSEDQAFRNKKIFPRLVILLAGVVVNFIFGVIAFAAVYSITGIPELASSLPYVTVEEIAADSPASVAGLQIGDELREVNDNGTWTAIETTQQFAEFVGARPDQDIALRIARNGEVEEVTVRTMLGEVNGQMRGRIGIVMSKDVYEFRFYPWWQMPLRGIALGMQESLNLGWQIVTSLGTMVRNLFMRGQVPTDLAGPIGIVDQTVESQILEQGWEGKLKWMGLISINLAIMNLLPIPALDGGRAIFLLFEPIIGRSRRLRWEKRANVYGFLFLMSLIIVISIKDVWTILR